MGTQGQARLGVKRGWPLQADFAVIALVVLMVGVGAGAFVHLRSEADAKKAAVIDAGYAAERAAKQIKFGFDTYASLTAPLATTAAWAAAFADPTLCSVTYAPIASFDTGHVDVIRPDGRVVCSSLGKGSTTTYAGQAWLEATKPTFAAPLVDAATGNQVAVYVHPIPTLGFFVWFVDLKALGPKLAYEYGSGTHQLEFLVVGSTGEGSFIVARSESSAKWTGQKLEGTPFSRASNAVDRSDVEGKPRWYAVANVEGAGWQVFVGADQAAALANASALQNGQLVITGIGVLAVLIAVLIVYRRIAKPIEQLSDAVRSSTGLKSPTVVPVGGPAQVADLATDFNSLITSLQREWTERESAEQNYLRLFEGSPLPTMFIDPITGKFLEVNDSAAAAFGYSKEEFLALSGQDLLAPKDREEAANAVAGEVGRERAQRQRFKYGPLTVKKKDGTAMRAVITSYAVAYGGRPARVTMVEDVTVTETLERQLNQSQRLDSLGQLAGGIAHDFNNLLGVILNFAIFAKEKVLAKEKTLASESGTSSSELQQAAKDMDRVVKAAESAARLTHQLLAFARREVTRPQSLNVNSVVAELEPLVSRTIGEHIQFVTSPGKDLWPALMDPGQLEQVLTNLVVNARDAMPKGGRLVIDCENVYVDETYAAGRPSLKPGRYIRIRVSDTGTGMDAKTLQRVFEPFFTTKPKGQGTGLGLATVHGIVNQAGGDISIYSELGNGTRVHVLLPAADEEPKTSEDEALTPRVEVSATILVVEDADDLREITERILTKAGYAVITAANGPAALELVKEHVGTIDLLLTDVVMPIMHGPDLAKRICSLHPDIQVLFMSGYAQPMLEKGGALEDGVLLIEKPFTAPGLLLGVDHALRTALVATAHK